MLIEMIEEEEKKETDILLPEDFKEEKSECVIVKVLDYAFNCNLRWVEGELAVVERNMIREIKVEDSTYLVVLENYIVGAIDEK
jgi:co-chaperonin GroES (HSP10)